MRPSGRVFKSLWALLKKCPRTSAHSSPTCRSASERAQTWHRSGAWQARARALLATCLHMCKARKLRTMAPTLIIQVSNAVRASRLTLFTLISSTLHDSVQGFVRAGKLHPQAKAIQQGVSSTWLSHLMRDCVLNSLHNAHKHICMEDG